MTPFEENHWTKAHLPIVLSLASAVPLMAGEAGFRATPPPEVGADDQTDAQPKLLRIAGTVDGSGRVRFTNEAVRYEHKQWSPPTRMNFGGEPWSDLARTPPCWIEFVGRVDLSKAWIVRRQGRDTIALEQTPDGFDLYLCDSPNGSGDYEVTIAIPRRP